jgi:preprotein translocase SecE subunit
MNLSNYIKSVVKELKLATFPTQNTVVNFTLFVIFFTAAMAIFLGVLDLFFGQATLKGIETLRAGRGLNVAETVKQAVDIATSTATNTLK